MSNVSSEKNTADSITLYGEGVNQQSLSSSDSVASGTETMSMKNFITGIAYFPDLATVTEGTGIRSCGFKGNNCDAWQTFAFSFDAGVEVTRSNVMLSLLGISNNKGANNLNYTFKNITSSQNGSKVTVTGQVLIGDTDGWLNQLGYLCVVA